MSSPSPSSSTPSTPGDSSVASSTWCGVLPPANAAPAVVSRPPQPPPQPRFAERCGRVPGCGCQACRGCRRCVACFVARGTLREPFPYPRDVVVAEAPLVRPWPWAPAAAANALWARRRGAAYLARLWTPPSASTTYDVDLVDVVLCADVDGVRRRVSLFALEAAAAAARGAGDADPRRRLRRFVACPARWAAVSASADASAVRLRARQAAALYHLLNDPSFDWAMLAARPFRSAPAVFDVGRL